MAKKLKQKIAIEQLVGKTVENIHIDETNTWLVIKFNDGSILNISPKKMFINFYCYNTELNISAYST